MEAHEHWIQVCIELGKQAVQTGNPPVGSVLVNAGILIGEGREAGKSKNDVTCHAEIECIRDALRKGYSVNMQDCTLYTTHEPCIMCSYVIRHHKIATVVIGVDVPVVGGASSLYPILTATDLSLWPDPPKVLKGVLIEDCEQLNTAYKKAVEIAKAKR